MPSPAVRLKVTPKLGDNPRFSLFGDKTIVRASRLRCRMGFLSESTPRESGTVLADLADASGHQQLLKGVNRMSLVRHLCTHPGRSRADLASGVGLTKSTVSHLVRELLAEGWLEEREIVVTGDVGRRPTPLFVDPGRLLLLGADVGLESVRVVATSLLGEVLASSVAAHGSSRTAKACLSTLTTALLKVIRQLDSSRQRAIGLGVGLPGGVDEATGFVHFAPNLAWRDVPFGRLLKARLADGPLDGIPLFVQNDADVAAVGEMEFHPQGRADPLLYLNLNLGVGAGVIVGDRLLTGHRGFAGEVGHIVLEVDGPLCSCGRKGCAEALVGLRAMARSADDGAAPTLTSIQRDLSQGHARTVRAVRKAGKHLGVLLHNLTAAYDPGCIVLGGTMVGLGDAFLDPAVTTLDQYAQAAGMKPPRVRLSRFGADAVSIGAAGLARYRLTRPLIAPVAGRHASDTG